MKSTALLTACAGLALTLAGCQALESLTTGTSGTRAAGADPEPLVAQCKRLVCEFPPLVPGRQDTPETRSQAIVAIKRWEAVCGQLPAPKGQDRVSPGPAN